jgi:two-component system, NarL family, response regulator NreC
MSGHLHIARDQAESPTGDEQASSAARQEPAARPVLRAVEPPIRVVLADDHALMRRSLRLLLENEQDLEVIAEAGDLQTVTRHVREHRPHVLVLDLGMPNGSSVQAIRRLRAEVPGTEIVVLTMEESPVFAQQALDAGAIGFVLKDMADEDLPPAIRRAARGQHYVSPRVAATLSALRRSLSESRLSGRETEVVRLIALGYTSAEIGDELHLSPRTVETHRERINQKLGLRTRRDVVRYALQHGLLAA